MSAVSLLSAARSETFSLEFSGLHYCLFVKVLRLAIRLQTRDFDILSYALFFVKTFFIFSRYFLGDAFMTYT
jgi:hypothetical protein